MSETYSDVDGATQPDEAVAWQERVARWRVIEAHKRRSHELLGGAELVLDVGSGPGDDLLALGVDRCVGVDRAAVMCARAQERGGIVVRAEAGALPFGDSVFDGARADRTLQHLTDPEAALRELLRVVRPGGTLVVVDPDQETLSIEVPGVRRSVLDRLEALRRDVGYRSGRWISSAPEMLAGLGARAESVESFRLVIEHPADAFGLPTWPGFWREEGAFTDEELAEWDAAMDGIAPGFSYAVTFVLVVSRVP
ncbi:methyltransferase domain-containing protein [Iamia majanohamensis]|uniref:Methyltransferase domain-containing protein n=1 Tax=Iamia majanohamensis TaxID=467976 RepID=A0AAE9Y604_9ACTN|nr:methyltransferase domain-containing protein [Iamia majanohamensis]WCO67260.1 methyltransferase domain-containing protein [Iamia majanohamensis]